MSRVGELQNSYLNSLNLITRTTSRAKSHDKKDDDSSQKNESSETVKSITQSQFPLTPNMLIMSACFWLIMLVLIFESIKYGTMYTRITMEADLKRECLDKFGSKDENLQRVDNYSSGDAEPYIFRLKPSVKTDYPMESTTLPPLVTAVSSLEFYQLQGLVNHIMEDLKNTHSDLKLIVYDIGLYKRERELVERYCHCEVRDFLFQDYPQHVADITNYAWRPIILQKVLEEFGSAVYVETTTRFKSESSLTFLKRRSTRNYFIWDYPTYTSLVAFTSKGMFEFLGENRCTFLDSSIFSPEAIVLYRTEVTWRELIKPWLKCALNSKCIAPQDATYSGCFELRHPHTTGCHRYDMSALSIILNRAVQYTLKSGTLISFRLTFRASEVTSYFPEQPWTYTEIILLCLLPFILIIFYKYFFRRRRCRC